MLCLKKNIVLDLLDESFPGLKANALRCEALNFPWASRAFLKEECHQVLAHVGLLDYPMLIDDHLFKAGALHAICTKVGHRGQGLASQLIQEALAWCKDRYQFVFLFTEIPGFYERLSFRPIQEYRFHLTCRHAKGSQTPIPMVSPHGLRIFDRRLRCLPRSRFSVDVSSSVESIVFLL